MIINKAFLSTLIILLPVLTQSIVQCPLEEGGGMCPDNAKCCKIMGVDGSPIGSGCIPNNKHLEGDGTCCYDDYDYPQNGVGSFKHRPHVVGSACAGNYMCDSKLNDDGIMQFFCSLHRKDVDGSDIVTSMPRYELVLASKKQLTMHGFPISINDKPLEQKSPPVIAYYSNRELINSSSSSSTMIEEDKALDSLIKVVIIVVHGSGRNGDEYLYSTMAVAQKQEKILPENILIIVPRFLVPFDNVQTIPVKIGSKIHFFQPMMWNETYPIPHTWRYGANALSPWSQISSYDVMDFLVEHFAMNSEVGMRYENLERIAIIGHSAGGQFVHRWALTSNSPAFGDRNLNSDETTTRTSSSRRLQKLNALLKVVVANPRSYCYLDERRFIHGELRLPPKFMVERCPNYNTWEWGLDDGGDLITPYRDRAIEYFNGDKGQLARRYAGRSVIYLSGNNDTEHLHGSCNDDEFQGRFRRERSQYYFESLKDFFGVRVHERYVVDDVGHDHSLVFASEEGIHAIFD
jgi:predicted esterase